MASHKARKLEVRERLIIEAAARLVERVGYSDLTMDMLAEEVGIAKATLYQHFKSKEDVMISSTLRALSNLGAFIDTNSGAAIDRLRAVMRYMMTSSYNADGFPTMVMHDEILHLFNHHPEIGATFGALNGRLFALVDGAKADGHIAGDLPNEIIISMMMNAVSTLSGRRVYDMSQSDDVLVSYTLRIFFKGLQP